ncbi:hypothetical protein E2C01_015724 [Portunus trituberculatus]|uniref:Uncharacterized protein n=1 Tax=Portunus trituberculatus TaxID=210409 RepID=A0A5B7DNY1_PORTR|nr:hypothetical protein [Portunus trituberculatus]
MGASKCHSESSGSLSPSLSRLCHAWVASGTRISERPTVRSLTVGSVRAGVATTGKAVDAARTRVEVETVCGQRECLLTVVAACVMAVSGRGWGREGFQGGHCEKASSHMRGGKQDVPHSSTHQPTPTLPPMAR